MVKHWNRLPKEAVGGPIPENIQGVVGRGSEQAGLVEYVTAYCRGGWAR